MDFGVLPRELCNGFLIFISISSYSKLFYRSWAAQEELCCALSSADSGKCQLCCSSVSNMFLERFKNSTVWNISIFFLLEENWGGVNSFLLCWSKKLYSVQVFCGWNQLLVPAEATRQGHLVGALAIVGDAGSPGTHGSMAVQDVAGLGIWMLTCSLMLLWLAQRCQKMLIILKLFSVNFSNTC